jgi:hypothetical protein
MRTTVRLDDHLLKRVKRFAAERDTTLTAVFEEALRERLARSERPPAPKQVVRLPTFAGNGPRPGVDLHDTAALLDRMDGADS